MKKVLFLMIMLSRSLVLNADDFRSPRAVSLSLDSVTYGECGNVFIQGTVSTDNGVIKRIEWNWGESSVSNDWLPVHHNYHQNNTYTIWATAYTSEGESISDSIDVTVVNAADPGCNTTTFFLGNPSYDVGGYCEINGFVSCGGGGCTHLNWDWGDESENDSWFPSSHAYTHNGAYPVIAEAHDLAGGVKRHDTITYIDTADPCPTILGSLPYGSARNAVLDGTMAYVSSGPVLVSLDISDPADPTEMGHLVLPGIIQDMALQGSLLYIADTWDGLRIVDVSMPTAPVEVGYYDTAGYATGVAVSGSYAYIADDWEGIKIIDVSNPVSPSKVGNYMTTGSAHNAFVVGSYLYVAQFWEGLSILDISTPSAPSEVGVCDTPGESRDLVVSDNHAFVADSGQGLRVIDVSNPLLPVEVGSAPSTDLASGIVVVGSLAYMSDGWGGVRIYDVSTPSLPVEVGVYDTPGFTTNLDTDGSLTIVPDEYGALILNVSVPSTPTLSGFYSTPGMTEGIDVEGNYLYAASGIGGLRVVDVTTPYNPVEVAEYNLPDFAHGVDIVGTSAYVADGWGGGLQILDVSDPLIPSFLGWYDTWGETRDVEVVGSHAYVASGDEGLYIIDISDPVNPTEEAHFVTTGSAWAVDVDGNYAYVAATWGGLRIIDISDPSNPVEITSVATTEEARDVTIHETYAYVADLGGGVRVIDISTPASSSEIGFFLVSGNCFSVATSGQHLYVGDDWSYRIYDLTTPSTPSILGSFNVPETVSGLAVRGFTGFAAISDSGLHAFDISECCTLSPGTFTLQSPADLTTNQACSVTFDWSESSEAIYYDLYMDTTTPPTTLYESGLTRTGYTASISAGFTYYWQVVARNGCGSTASASFSFSTCPAACPFSLVSPADTSGGIALDPVLDWGDSACFDSYTLYLDESPTPAVWETDILLSEYSVTGLKINTTYYWQVEAVGPLGNTLTPVWSFTTECFLPGEATLIAPVFGEGFSQEMVFAWDALPNAQTYNLYVGTWEPPPLELWGVTGTRHTVLLLQNSQTYYWSVESVNECGVIPSALHTFTTTCATPVSHLDRGSSWAVATDGSYAYYGRSRYFTVANITDPANPVVVGEVKLPGSINQGLYLSGNYAYVACGGGELQIIDISVPSNPVIAAGFPATGACGLRVIGNMLYTAGWDSVGFRIINVTNPLLPTEIGSFTGIPNAHDVDIAGDYAYVCDFYSGLYILDISNPLHPRQVGFLDANWGYMEGIRVLGDYAYIADGEYGLRVVDVSDPANPVETWSYDVPGWGEYITVDGSTLYMPAEDDGVYTFDISTPGVPVFLGLYDSPGLAMDIAITAGGLGCVADHQAGGLRIIDVSDPANPFELGGITPHGYYYYVVLEGNYAYAASGSDGITIVDVSDPANPIEIAKMDIPGSAESVSIIGNYLYVSDRYYGVRIVDVSTPSSPVEMNVFPTDSQTYEVESVGSLGYMADYYGGMRVLNVSDPLNPVEIGNYNPSQRINDLSVEGNIAVVVLGNAGIAIVDVSDPVNPVEMSQFVTRSYAIDVVLNGVYAYVSAYYDGLQVINISDPYNPVEVDYLALPSIRKLKLSGSSLYLSAMSGGMRVIDISDPLNISESLAYDPFGAVYGAEVSGLTSFLSETSLGLEVIDLSACCSAAPAAFNLLTPGNGSLDQPIDAMLDWEESSGALYFRVYLDTVDPPVAVIADAHDKSSYRAILAGGMTYYWKVAAVNGCGMIESPVFSFSTAAPPGEAGKSVHFSLVKNGTDIDFSWGEPGGSCGWIDYALYTGNLSTLITGYSHDDVLTCTEPTTGFTIAADDPLMTLYPDQYFIIVSSNDTAEGSYGTSYNGGSFEERPISGDSCHGSLKDPAICN